MSSTTVPTGLTDEQFATFLEYGFLHIRQRLQPHQVESLREAVTQCASKSLANTRIGHENVIELHDEFCNLIDSPAHVGIAYDFFGEMLKLHLSQFTIRTPGYTPVPWHHDGPRPLPYSTLSPLYPPVIKCFYWLTPVADDVTANLSVLPRSQYDPEIAERGASIARGDESILRACPGDLTVFDARIWHRTLPNDSLNERVAVALSYGPAWLCGQDRSHRPAEFLARLSRTQRILLRSYEYPYSAARPPREDYPLFLGSSHDSPPGIDSRRSITNYQLFLSHFSEESKADSLTPRIHELIRLLSRA
jgi:hypothetical protein